MFKTKIDSQCTVSSLRAHRSSKRPPFHRVTFGFAAVYYFSIRLISYFKGHPRFLNLFTYEDKFPIEKFATVSA